MIRARKKIAAVIEPQPEAPLREAAGEEMSLALVRSRGFGRLSREARYRIAQHLGESEPVANSGPLTINLFGPILGGPSGAIG